MKKGSETSYSWAKIDTLNAKTDANTGVPNWVGWNGVADVAAANANWTKTAAGEEGYVYF